MVAVERFYEYITSDDTPSDLRPVLTKLASLYSLWSLEKHLATLYQGGGCVIGNYSRGEKYWGNKS